MRRYEVSFTYEGVMSEGPLRERLASAFGNTLSHVEVTDKTDPLELLVEDVSFLMTENDDPNADVSEERAQAMGRLLGWVYELATSRSRDDVDAVAANAGLTPPARRPISLDHRNGADMACGCWWFALPGAQEKMQGLPATRADCPWHGDTWLEKANVREPLSRQRSDDGKWRRR